jgi:hypothetical protein
MRIILRVLAIMVAYLVASLVASAVMVTIWVRPEVSDFLGTNPQRGAIWGLFLFMAVVIAALTALPALMVIIYAETAGRRSLLFYCLACGGTALILGGAIARGVLTDWAIITLGGLAAGLVYWALAGRKAGAARRRRSARAWPRA